MSEHELFKGYAEFREWFLGNYPPHCILSSPEWHAERIFRTAVANHRRAQSALPGAPGGETTE